MRDQDAQGQYQAYLAIIRREYGDQAALAARAMAFLRHAHLTTLGLIAEMDKAGVLAEGASATIPDLWSAAQSRTMHAILAPLIAGKTDDEASALVGTISQLAKMLAALSLQEQSTAHWIAPRNRAAGFG